MTKIIYDYVFQPLPGYLLLHNSVYFRFLFLKISPEFKPNALHGVDPCYWVSKWMNERRYLLYIALEKMEWKEYKHQVSMLGIKIYQSPLEEIRMGQESPLGAPSDPQWAGECWGQVHTRLCCAWTRVTPVTHGTCPLPSHSEPCRSDFLQGAQGCQL